MPGARAVLGVLAFVVAGCASEQVDALVTADTATALADAARRAEFGVSDWPTSDEQDVALYVRRLLAAPLSDDVAVAIALVQNSEIRAAYARLGVVRAEYVQAGLLSNPVLSGDSYRFDSGSEIEGALVVSVVDAFLRPLRTRAAAHDVAAARLRLSGDLVRVAFETRRAHARAVGAEELRALRETALASTEASRRLTQRLFDAGNVTGLEMAREDATVGRARLDLHEAEAALRESREDLNAILGTWGPDTQYTLSAESPRDPPGEMQFAAIETQAVGASLDLAAERAEIESAAQRAGLVAWGGLVPTLDLGAAAKREPTGDWGVGPSYVVELPIFDLGQARVAGAEADLRARLAEFEGHAIDIRRAARRFADRVLTLREREAFLRSVYLDARERVVHETLLTYNAMQVGAFDVLVARRQQIEAQREHVETRHALALATLDLAELVAGRLNHEREAGSHLPHGDGAESQRAGAAGAKEH